MNNPISFAKYVRLFIWYYPVDCRPYLSARAIQTSSPKNLFTRSSKGPANSSFMVPSSLNVFCTTGKLRSACVTTSLSSRTTGTSDSITRVPPHGPAETPTRPTALWAYSLRSKSSIDLS